MGYFRRSRHRNGPVGQRIGCKLRCFHHSGPGRHDLRDLEPGRPRQAPPRRTGIGEAVVARTTVKNSAVGAFDKCTTAPLLLGRILDCGVVGQTGHCRLRGHVGGTAGPVSEVRIGTMLARCPIPASGCFGDFSLPIVLKAPATATSAEDTPAKSS